MDKGRERMAAAAAAAAAAAQCRSPRCAAERRGFRRELDSWRHRLMHCVGFESILEGLYGPRLRRDLSLFEDCEPEELTDWSMDEKCSFCNLQREAVSDCIPSLDSSQSTPTEELSSQGQSNTEKIECQAENYLNALFRKKDLPQNCDPNIPLVAQELMKKMIRQFAIEYISKSGKIQENRNGSIGPSLICKSIQMNQAENSLQEEQEGPLDLTVNRMQEQNTQQGFESILEGLYGPRLRRDLSLFEDCEPEELTDWSMDEKCSFCNLQREAVSDCIPSLDSSQSTPTEELSSQGQSNTEKIECQAENYLNALFRKKGDGVLDLSTKKTSIKSEESSICDPSSENSMAGALHRRADERLNVPDGSSASGPLSPTKMCLTRPTERNPSLTAASLASCTAHNQNLKSGEK